MRKLRIDFSMASLASSRTSATSSSDMDPPYPLTLVPTASPATTLRMFPGDGHVEDDDGQIVLPTYRDRRLVHELQILANRLVVGEPVVTNRVRVALGIGAVDPVHLRRLQDHVGVNLRCAQGGGGVGGEVGVPGPPGEDHHPTLLEVAHRPAPDVGLRDLADLEGRQHPGVEAHLFQRVLKRHSVHHAGQHSHVVGGGAVHALVRRGHSPNDVAAADHDADLRPERVYLAHLLGQGPDHAGTDAEAALSGENLAGELRITRR